MSYFKPLVFTIVGLSTIGVLKEGKEEASPLWIHKAEHSENQIPFQNMPALTVAATTTPGTIIISSVKPQNLGLNFQCYQSILKNEMIWLTVKA